jgi:hypothetical protein
MQSTDSRCQKLNAGAACPLANCNPGLDCINGRCVLAQPAATASVLRPTVPVPTAVLPIVTTTTIAAVASVAPSGPITRNLF